MRRFLGAAGAWAREHASLLFWAAIMAATVIIANALMHELISRVAW